MTLIIFQIGLESLGPCPSASDHRLLLPEVISSVACAQPKFVNASHPCALPACLFCFRQSIKEQYSAHNCLWMCFPVIQHLWQIYFKDYRFWCSLTVLLECQSTVREQDVTKMRSICRREKKKRRVGKVETFG